MNVLYHNKKKKNRGEGIEGEVGGTGATSRWIGSHQLSIVSHLSYSLAFCMPSQFSSCHPLHFAIQAPSITVFSQVSRTYLDFILDTLPVDF